jgi:peptidoglycan hydrolase-like protein with peptidoglycan-binding domain
MAKFEHNSEKFGYINLETLAGVQTALTHLGFEPGAVDGRDGPKTQDAVRKFQARSTIKIDGIVGDETRAALVSSLEAKTEATASTGT